MTRRRLSAGYAAFTLIEMVVVMVILSGVTVGIYLPLSQGVKAMRINRQCQAVQGQFSVVFDRVKMEMSQAGTVINVDSGTSPGGGAPSVGTVDDNSIKWMTYQTLSGSLRLLYYSPSASLENGGDLYTYDFPTSVSDSNAVAAHNTYVAAHTTVTGTKPALPSGALPLAKNMSGFAMNLFYISNSAFLSASNIARADVLRLEAKPNAPECATMPPQQADIAVRHQGQAASTLVISEVMYETSADDYVEILNPLSVSVNVDTMRLDYAPNSTGVTISYDLPNRTLLPGERLILAAGTASVTSIKRAFPQQMATQTPDDPTPLGASPAFPADLEGAGTLMLVDPLSSGKDTVTVAQSACPWISWSGAATTEFTGCEDYVRYGSLISEDFEWGTASVSLSESGALASHGWALSDSGDLLASYKGLTHRRLGEVISGQSTPLNTAVLLPAIDGDGNQSGGVLTSFEVSGSKALNNRWWLENKQILTLTGTRTVYLRFANLREFDKDADADREFAVQHCASTNPCWVDHLGAGWTTLASTNTKTAQLASPDQEMRVSSNEGFDVIEASAALGAGSYKFRLLFKTGSNYSL